MQLLPEELNHILHWPLLSHVTDGASGDWMGGVLRHELIQYCTCFLTIRVIVFPCLDRHTPGFFY